MGEPSRQTSSRKEVFLKSQAEYRSRLDTNWKDLLDIQVANESEFERACKGNSHAWTTILLDRQAEEKSLFLES
jgi:hypothetical protein